MNNDKNHIICIITEPIGNASKAPVSNLVNILLPLSNKINFITGNIGCDLFKDSEKIRSYGMQYKLGSNFLIKIVRYFGMQLRICQAYINVCKNSEIVIFFIGANTLLLPIITAKLLEKNVVLLLSGSFTNTLKFANNRFVVPVKIMERINYSLASFILLYSPSLIKEYEMEDYKNKILIAHEHFINFNKFRIDIPLCERKVLIGYFGRLSEEKGVLDFVSAISELSKEVDDAEYLIVGDGRLRKKIEKFLKEEKLIEKVSLAGWIPHEKLPEYFNKLKLLVMPSYTEGLPNIMLEAMACGIPVLATPVGAIPDIIKDGETGFLMENNYPSCIATNVIRALNHPELEEIAQNARALVERKFTFERTVERWRKVLEEVGYGER